MAWKEWGPSEAAFARDAALSGGTEPRYPACRGYMSDPFGNMTFIFLRESPSHGMRRGRRRSGLLVCRGVPNFSTLKEVFVRCICCGYIIRLFRLPAKRAPEFWGPKPFGRPAAAAAGGSSG